MLRTTEHEHLDTRFTYDIALDEHGDVHLFVHANKRRKQALRGELMFVNDAFVYVTSHCRMVFNAIPDTVKKRARLENCHLWEVNGEDITGNTMQGPVEPVGFTPNGLIWWYGQMAMSMGQLMDRPLLIALCKIYNERPRIVRAMDESGNIVGLIDRRRVGGVSKDIEWMQSPMGFLFDKSISSHDPISRKIDSSLRNPDFQTQITFPHQLRSASLRKPEPQMLMGVESHYL